jgi:hypothetical protein
MKNIKNYKDYVTKGQGDDQKFKPAYVFRVNKKEDKDTKSKKLNMPIVFDPADKKIIKESLTQEQYDEKIEMLQEALDAFKKAINLCDTAVRETGMIRTRADSYWLSHIKAAVSESYGYSSMFTLEGAIDEMREEASGFIGESGVDESNNTLSLSELQDFAYELAKDLDGEVETEGDFSVRVDFGREKSFWINADKTANGTFTPKVIAYLTGKGFII